MCIEMNKDRGVISFGGERMRGISQYLSEHGDVESIISGVKSGLNEQLITGLSSSARSMWIGTIHKKLNKRSLIVTNQLTQAQKLYDDLVEILDPNDVHLYPVNELLIAEMAVASPELRSQRIVALTTWLKKKSDILIIPVAALKRILPPIDYWGRFQIDLEVDDEIDVDKYLLTLVQMGYERVDMVSNPAEFSMRGGIIDLYPITELNPIRVELFDNQVDSIRYFDVTTQRSLEVIEQIQIKPTTEFLLTDKDMMRTADRLENGLATSLSKMQDKNEKSILHQQISHEIERLRENEKFEELYKYSHYFYENPASLLDYLGEEGYVFLDEIGRVEESINQLDQSELELIESLLRDNKIVRDLSFSYGWKQIVDRMKQQKIYLSVFLRHVANTTPQNIINVSSRAMQQFHGQMNLLQGEISRWEKLNYSVVFLAPNSERAGKIQSILADYQVDADINRGEIKLPLKKPTITVGNLTTGFELPFHKLAVLTDQELFKSKLAKRKPTRQKLSNAERIKSYQELKEGDYVVHVNHGVGQFIGIETLEVQGIQKEFMRLQYHGDDRLFVPVDQIDLVQKFVGSEGKEPKLYKLGGTEWSKVKSKVQTKVEDIADDLIKLYAEREATKGYAFSKDGPLQREFEDAFPYQETEDQLQSIEEIKRDMEKPFPMDRLLCGDVGYGKTEVAIRAAFKAIMDGKQVAILVPTTILAQQHYETFLERFQDYPVEIKLLSRFRTRKEQQDSIKGIKQGAVDIVIGTHRLLSKDVEYKDLGLLVVDEEQRFGVKHKEIIKQIKTTVDVLTLTATPIPRTLHMSMLGVRDLSILETPPANRFPIQTYVLEYNPTFLREAIEREMGRGGQVFFLYNRVATIERKAQEIELLVEDARVAVAHGQMNETELENTMIAFLNGEYDVLVSTTIIETGVDIPNVNTLIVDQADRMGLSQLYQLRGRVGRSNRVAYAYLTYQKDKVLSEIAEKRLQVIREFTELGSGFKIAMRDLSIRGSGNILGAQQHGFIDSVGFDLYSEMLKESIEKKKLNQDNQIDKPVEPELNLSVEAYIPDSYISESRQKINMYKRFRAIDDYEGIEDIKDELIDRFGDYPKEVENLIAVCELRIDAKAERAIAIREIRNRIIIVFDEQATQSVDGEKLFKYATDFGRMMQVGTEKEQLKITLNFERNTLPHRYQYVRTFLDELKNLKQ